ncbi:MULTISPECIES: bifunctional oligoribonuclease/PAP phosphatase NrnA [unclassified Nitratiruptor]|uniref:DHH family phosphoesterase n=1 Tax=unclassified Nitratiruptor TaxID=2624044 RepID=UPI001915D846|nr:MULTISPECIES: bifunctional oligoribonuclease/PAP phosphatase NrnA [unclassified Nitratiruptor]BCD59754.1 bifunctional oligoribonuclease and PAP phosphatase NrnA [Nitratiruptor sp. YY08-10]BCD63678.1 bifunctional oligoribonuclease and PAP phosphatase NrnA [Nitratiruptor sp. YY08-14]
MTEALRKIQEVNRIVLLTHVNPDADTLGSALGMYHILQKMGKKAVVVNTTELPYNLDFLPGIEKVKKQLPSSYELMISFDCGSFDRLGIEEKEAFLINFDHHKSNTLYGDVNIIQPEYASTSQVVYEFAKNHELPVDKNAAICFYTALVDDCGFFKYDTVNAKTFEFAKELCEKGVIPEYVATMLTMREPLSKIRLITYVLETLELRLNAKVAVVRVTQEMLRKSGGTKEMADDALNMARSLVTVEVAILLREEEDGRIKVSLRSKNEVDVSVIAIMFGGGGHKRAAGFTAQETSFEKVLDALLEVLKKEID